MDRFVVAVLVALLPSKLKILVLRMMGHEIGKNVYIGMSILNIKKIVLKDGVKIKNFNYLKNLSCLTMMENSAIEGSFNWFTARDEWSTISNRNHAGGGFGCIEIGEGTRILSRQYFDIQARIKIGKHSLIAGSNSVFYTHSVIADQNYGVSSSPIVIGDYCYIGSHCILLPGSAIGSCTFVGAGSVVTKNFSDKNYVLIAGNPASVKKTYSAKSKFFGYSKELEKELELDAALEMSEK